MRKSTRVKLARTELVFVVAVLALAGPAAEAHQSSVSYVDVGVDGHTVHCSIAIADNDLAPALGLEREGAVARDQVTAHQRALFDYVTSRVHVENGGAACAPDARELGFDDKGDGFFARVDVAFVCKRTASDVTLKYDLFFDLDPRHQAFARILVAGQPERQHLFRNDDRLLKVSRPTTLLENVRDYLVLGIEHIFTGYDHLAFLFGLLVVAGFENGLRRGLRYVLGVVTAFTLAHSITLIASGLDWVRLSPRFVEPAIALSIFYVAVENLYVKKPRFRWLLTFCFGLVHGFGFASVLREIGLPARGLVLSLLSFNVGVEVGQLSVVAAIAPLLWLLARGRVRLVDPLWLAALATLAFFGLGRFGLPPVQLAIVVVGAPALLLATVPRVGYDRALRVGGSVVLASLAAFWFLERVLEKSWLGGQLG